MITKDQWKKAAQISRDQGDPTKLETLVSRSLLEEQQGPPGVSRPPTDLERGTARKLEVTIERKVLEKGERPKPIGHKASELEKVKAASIGKSKRESSIYESLTTRVLSRTRRETAVA